MESLANDPRFNHYNWIFVYTREAHPGEKTSAHETMEDKFLCAQRLKDRWHINRSILVDDLSGTTHRAYGGLPNMSYIVEPPGVVIFRADWTDSSAIEWALTRLNSANGSRVSQSMSYTMELMSVRNGNQSRNSFLEVLVETGGTSAKDDFLVALRNASR